MDSRAHDWWQTDKFCREFSHFAGQAIVGLSIDLPGPRQYLFTGFLFDYNRKLFVWVTAGHVIKQLLLLIDSNKEYRPRWCDVEDCTEAPIPAVLDPDCMLRIEEDGIDIGLIYLRKNFLDLFCASGSNAVITDEDIEFDLHSADGALLVGNPSELLRTAPSTTGSTSLFWPTICLPIELISAEFSEDGYTDFYSTPNSVFGRILPFADTGADAQPNSIEFMSGGPLFSVRRDDSKFQQRLIGIQSSWLPKKRVIRATDANTFLRILDAINDDLSKVEPNRAD